MYSGLKYEVNNLGEAWFNKIPLKNIFSFANLVDKFRIKYDSKIEDAFWVYVGNNKVKFKRLVNRTYGMCPVTTNDEQKKLLQIQRINTVDKNNFFFTERQEAEAKRARELFNLVG